MSGNKITARDEYFDASISLLKAEIRHLAGRAANAGGVAEAQAALETLKRLETNLERLRLLAGMTDADVAADEDESTDEER